eukprot:scaffold230498_cov25-Prasinocladus_malaysianus.AAC.2
MLLQLRNAVTLQLLALKRMHVVAAAAQTADLLMLRPRGPASICREALRAVSQVDTHDAADARLGVREGLCSYC